MSDEQEIEIVMLKEKLQTLTEENERVLATAKKNWNELQTQLKINQQLMDIIEMMTGKLVDK
jgi:hypothetical protein